MKIVSRLYVLLFIALTPAYAGQAFRTDVADKSVKSLQIRVDGQEALIPCIPLDGGKQLEINFDMLLSDGYRPLAYSIVHCDADWQPSSLLSIEYMSGYQGVSLHDFANAMATTTQYTNFCFFLPNDEIQFKVSGNYVVKVYEEAHPDRILFTACFSVSESLVNIAAGVSSNTLIDTNQSHQEVSFSINHSRLPITYPQTDLKVRVYQNGRRDNAVSNPQPTSLLNNQVVYEHNRDLIFEAGNEYRRMEFLSSRYNGIHVEDISFHNPYYHVDLTTDRIRGNLTYQYDQDQNGRFLVNCSSCTEPDTEADYHVVHFALQSPLLTDGDLYLLGSLYNNVLDEKSKIGYNTETGRYEKSVQLKQGHYNYMYLFVPRGEQRGTPRITEGNYYQADNEYDIMVYYRPMNTRYDRLVGVRHVRSR